MWLQPGVVLLMAILSRGASNSESSTEVVPLYQSKAVVDTIGVLPCNTTAISASHPPILVIWYKNGGGDPVYSYDLRGRGPENARHWSDDHVLGTSRAKFFMAKTNIKKTKEPLLSVLKIRGIRDRDRGLYRCRVDFKAAPTRNTRANLTVIVPPKSPVIVNEAGREATSQLGPYNEGSTVQISCEVSEGRPKPLVRWFWSGRPLVAASEVSSGSTVTSNVILPGLKRSDDGILLTCEARNNNISTPAKHSVVVKMNLPPTAVWVNKKDQHLLAGKEAVYNCGSTGASPRSKFSWMLGEKIINGNEIPLHQPVNMSVLRFTPERTDHNKVLLCQVENPDLVNSALQDSVLLKVHYLPIVSLQFGTILKPDSIKEGDDIYFECIVEARPTSSHIDWFINGHRLSDDIATGVIISNHSLVLQRVTRKAAGIYTCLATNAEGSTTSNSLKLNVKYSPICGFGEPRVVGVAMMETVDLVCDVVSNPNRLVFHWNLNKSIDGDPLTTFAHNGTRSVLHYSPSTQNDYGTVLCFANNEIGRQREPCQFHVIPAGRPDSVSNCSQLNHSADTIVVNCSPGFDGGLTQLFTIELRYLKSSSSDDDASTLDQSDVDILVRNITLSRPEFEVRHLESGKRYEASVFSSNRKGRSSPVILRVSTLKRPSEGKRLATTASGGQNEDVLVVARDDEVRDSLTKMMTTKADSGGMSSIFHNWGKNFSLRTMAFLLVSTIAIVLVVSVSIGLICKVQCSTSSNSQGHVLNSPRIEREAILSTNSSDKLLENESQNSVLHRSSSTATSSLVLNPDDEIPINESETNTVIIPSAELYHQRQAPQTFYPHPGVIPNSMSHGNIIRSHCSTFVSGSAAAAAAASSAGGLGGSNSEIMALNASMLTSTNGNNGSNNTTTDFGVGVPTLMQQPHASILRSSVDNLLSQQHPMMPLLQGPHSQMVAGGGGGVALSNFNNIHQQPQTAVAMASTSSSSTSSSSFLHTFPRNHNTQHHSQNLRTTASGVSESVNVCCSRLQHVQQHHNQQQQQQRRKTVTFLDTNVVACPSTQNTNMNTNSIVIKPVNTTNSVVDELPLPPPPLNSAVSSTSSGGSDGPTTSVDEEDEDSVSTIPNEDYVESRV